MSTRPRTCAQNFLPNLTQSLANSRLALLHLYVPFTLQRIGQRDNSYRLPAASVRLRFPRFSCTKTAIYAGAAAVAVNHPHHTNHVNHSSNKCQPALANALIPVNPSSHRVCRHAPKISHTISHILSQSLAISRVSLVHLYVPLTFQRIGQRSDSCRLPAGRIPLRSARFPCTKTAICADAAAVYHPHHIIT